MVPAEDAGLARFGIYFLSIKGTKLDNNTLSTSVVLCNIQMDDMRKNTNSQIRQYLSRKDWVQPKLDTDEIIDACYNERNFMVDVTAIIKEDDTFGWFYFETLSSSDHVTPSLQLRSVCVAST